MKHIYIYIFIPIVISLSGCFPQIAEMEKAIFIYGYDFTKYSKEGFLITTESYDGDYESIALFEMKLRPEIKKAVGITREKNFYGKWEEDVEEGWEISTITTSEVLDSMYVFSKSLGADAVINFKMDTFDFLNKSYILQGIKASGFAIKRKSK